MLEQVKAAEADFTAKFPELPSLSQKASQLASDIGDTDSMAEKIATAERDLYQNLYAEYGKDNSQPNPCKDFVIPMSATPAASGKKGGRHRHSSQGGN